MNLKLIKIEAGDSSGRFRTEVVRTKTVKTEKRELRKTVFYNKIVTTARF